LVGIICSSIHEARLLDLTVTFQLTTIVGNLAEATEEAS
jgi:hypothetical protein